MKTMLHIVVLALFFMLLAIQVSARVTAVETGACEHPSKTIHPVDVSRAETVAFSNCEPAQTPVPTEPPTPTPAPTELPATPILNEPPALIPESTEFSPAAIQELMDSHDSYIDCHDVEEPDEADVEMLACAIYQEAGGNGCSDKCRYMVGDVILNRVSDDRFPDTMELVLTQERQFGGFYWTGVVWPDRASYSVEADAVQRAYDTARALLSGEHSEIYGAGYVFLAEFEQGRDIIEIDGLYFGR